MIECLKGGSGHNTSLLLFYFPSFIKLYFDFTIWINFKQVHYIALVIMDFRKNFKRNIQFYILRSFQKSTGANELIKYIPSDSYIFCFADERAFSRFSLEEVLFLLLKIFVFKKLIVRFLSKTVFIPSMS